MDPEILKELEKLKDKIPPELLVSTIRSLYFQTAWELCKELLEVGIDKNLVWELQLEIARKTGIQGANSIRSFQFSGPNLLKLAKSFMFAALNMGVKSDLHLISPEKCELTFKKNCGHGLKIKEYDLPFTCSEWCEEHFNSELQSLDPNFKIKLIEGLPQGKNYCRFCITKIKK